jgi:hypothetical protein
MSGCNRRHKRLSEQTLDLELAAIAQQEVAGAGELVRNRLERND